MSKKKYYTKNELWDHGTRVKALDTSEYAHWNKYPMTVVAFRWREDGGIDYRVRAWRTNQHWIPAEDLEKLGDANYCSNCMRLMQCQNCGGCCHHG